jgi:aspartyl-tRNA(Asn)/glutamyl-tRNA(Gln) amidotransferase subunit A
MSGKHSAQSLATLSVLIQSGNVDPVEVAGQTLQAIRDHPDQSIFVEVFAERALSEAKAASQRIRAGRSLGLLDGIPIAWKDLFDIRGKVTTAGSVVLSSDPPAPEDAAVVTALASAGMVSVGSVNMSEFAFSGLGLNPHYGTPKNAASKDGIARVPGGSSSGSAVSVAAGLVPVSIGTDTGGSVRIPAAFNGLVGYKATRGRYSMKGVFPLAKSLDSLGPLCRTVQDALWIDAAMRGRAPVRDEVSLSDIALVIPQTVVFDDAEDCVVASFNAAIARLEGAGVSVRYQAFPAFTEIFNLMARYGPLVTAEAFSLHRERLLGPEAARMDRRVVTRARLGEKITLSDYLRILATRERLIEDVANAVGPREFIAFPTVAHVAPLIAPLIEDDDLFARTNAKTLRNTLIGNFLDWCGISIPCGCGDAGMPVGFQLSGLANQDDRLLAASVKLEPIIGRARLE